MSGTALLEKIYHLILDTPFEVRREWVADGMACSVPDLQLDLANVRCAFDEGGLTTSFDGQASYTMDEFMRSLAPSTERGVSGQITPDDDFGVLEAIAPKGRLVLERCITGRHNRRGDGYISGSMGVGSVLEVFAAREGEGVFIDSYVLANWNLKLWTRPVRRESLSSAGVSISSTDFRLNIDGMDIWVRKVGTPDGLFARVLVPQPTGVPWRHREVLTSELLPAIGFLLGDQPFAVQEELWSVDGALLERRVLNRSTHHVGKHAIAVPIPHHPQLSLESLFSRILTSYARQKQEIFLDDVIYFMHYADRSPAEAKFALYSIAFEALASSFARRKAGGQEITSTYLPHLEFRKVLKPVRRAFCKELRARGLDRQSIDSVDGKLCAVNNRAMADRASGMLQDLGILSTEHIKKLLKLRNNVIHEGVLTRDRPPNWQAVFDYEHGMLTLLHKCLLRVLEYEGPFVDYSEHGHPLKTLRRDQPDTLVPRADPPDPEFLRRLRARQNGGGAGPQG